MEKKFIIVAYVDLIGYSKWKRSALTPPMSKENFMDKFYDEMKWFVLSSDFKVKYVGDGCMVLRELDQKGERMYDALRFLFGIDMLLKKVQTIIQDSDYPPDGIRARAVAGPADKKEMPDPDAKDRRIWEYSSEAIDVASRLLQVKPMNPLVCHKSAVELIGKDFPNIVVKKLSVGSLDPKRLKINPEDLEGLCELKFRKEFHIA